MCPSLVEVRHKPLALARGCADTLLFFFFARNAVMSRMDRCVSGVAFSPSPKGRRALPLLFVGLIVSGEL
jgi:hypothetical protein